jgi:hypothetical protein
MNTWIPVTERLPEQVTEKLLRKDGTQTDWTHYPEVIVATADGRITTACLWDKRHWKSGTPEWNDDRENPPLTNVTHWMPMPTPPTLP